MITLYGIGPGFGLPEISPFVSKSEVQLKMAMLAFEKHGARPDDSPKGLVPFIADGEEKIGDSAFIRHHIEAKYGVDLDAGLSDVQRAQAWAIERMVENHFNWTIVHTRWLMPENFAKGPAHFFDDVPEEVREQALAGVQAEVRVRRATCIGRHSEEEFAILGAHSLRALSALLGEKRFLFGDKPCGVDATAFAMLAGLMTPYFESDMQRLALTMGNLVAYVDRMMARYYPAFPWKEQRAEAA